jgi:methionine-R-sulfoxide reductase
MNKLAFSCCLGLLLGGIALVSAAPPATSSSKNSTANQKAPAMIDVHVFNRKGELVGPVKSPKVVLTVEEWKKRLTTEQFQVLRSKGTERPFCGPLLDNKQPGVYTCAGCGLPLFSSDSKFHSGTGWPSFFQPISKENVAERADHSHGMTREEINCARCDGHLGHVFDDGPRPTGLRFCLNSASLVFTPSDKLASLADLIAEIPPSAEAAKPAADRP